MLQRQREIAHSQGKVGYCPFCREERAELWYNPANEDDYRPFQVRCTACGASGPWCDCGWESAVPAWDMVERKEGFQPSWRGPGHEHALVPPASLNEG